MTRRTLILPMLAMVACSSTSKAPKLTSAPTDAAQKNETRELGYDYIIVGGGTAGCVVAGRLAEEKGLRLLLLEAGGDRFEQMRIPAAWPGVYARSKWALQSLPSKHLGNQPTTMVWGKGLGGSAAGNFQGVVRGSPADYQRWDAWLGGNSRWNWDTALAYFKKAEFFDKPGADERYRSRDSSHPFYLREAPFVHPLSEAFLAAAVQAGHRKTDDYNAGQMEGVGLLQVNTRKGVRITTCDAYLGRASAKSPVEVKTGARVDKVLVEAQGQSARATGVSYTSSLGVFREVLAPGGEVLVAAGPFHSPKLLMLSGLGPAAHLKSLGIEVVKDLQAVGQHLVDHTMVRLVFKTKESVVKEGKKVSLGLPRFTRDAKALRAEWEQGKGPMTTTGNESTLFLKSPYANAIAPVAKGETVPPDLEMWLNNWGDSRVAKEIGKTANVFRILIFHNVPGGAGSVQLASKNPEDRVVWSTALLSDERELKALMYGVEEARKIARKLVYPGTTEKVVAEELLPSTELKGKKLENWIRTEGVSSGYHPVGSCRMGRDASTSVVDAELRVHGVSGLRVVDSSVMPSIPRGNTMMPTIMVAEHAADIIKAARASSSK